MFVANTSAGAPIVFPVSGQPGLTGQDGKDGTQGEQGETGADGKPGPAGAGSLISRTATAFVQIWTAIVADGTAGCRPADPSDLSQRQQVIAVTAYGGAPGAPVEGVNTGDLQGPTNGFVPNTTLFVGPGGALISEPPTSGWSQAVASVIADGHIVVNLGEAAIIADDVAMVATGGFSTPASPTDVRLAEATDRHLTPARLADVAAAGNPVGDSLTASAQRLTTAVPATPYDSIPDPTLVAALKRGDEGYDARAYLQAWADAAVANAGTLGGTITLPDGNWTISGPIRLALRSPGPYRRFVLQMSRAAKLIAGPTNQYRYAARAWDATANAIAASSLAIGDVLVATTPNDFLTGFPGVTNVNVGDAVRKHSATEYRKILCVARYHPQSLNAETNRDTDGNRILVPGVGEEYDSYIINTGGTLNVDDVGAVNAGDEVIFIWGRWRPKTIRGGSYQGTWNPGVPNSGPCDGQHIAGRWWVVTGGGSIYFRDLGNGNKTGVGNFIQTIAGHKVWDTGESFIEVFASPTLYGQYRPSTDDYLGERCPTAANPGDSNQLYPPQLGYFKVAGRGGYGMLLEVTDGDETASWQAGEALYYGAQGVEKIARDPDYDVGLLHITFDDKTQVALEGVPHVISRIDPRVTPELTNGVAIDISATYRTGPSGPLYQGQQVVVDDILSECDAADAAGGAFSRVLRITGATLPIVKAAAARTAQCDAADFDTRRRANPRAAIAALSYRDCYVVTARRVQCNGSFASLVEVEGRQWGYHTGNEGGEIEVLGSAGPGKIVEFRNGFRQQGNAAPTLKIVLGDVSYQIVGVDIVGKTNVSCPLVRLEDVSGAIISAPLLAGGFYVDQDNTAAVLKTRGYCNDINIAGPSIANWRGGVLYILDHNRNSDPLQFGSSGAGLVTSGPVVGYTADTSGARLFQGQGALLRYGASALGLGPSDSPNFKGLNVLSDGDAALTLDATSAPSTAFGTKQFINSLNRANDLIIRATRKSDGASIDWTFVFGSPGDVLTTGTKADPWLRYAQVQDADYQALATDTQVGMTSLSAARTIYLPDADAYQRGQILFIADESGACSPGRAITITTAPGSGDTIAGQSAITLTSPYAGRTFRRGAANLWVFA
jgi:hypothetical protein